MKKLCRICITIVCVFAVYLVSLYGVKYYASKTSNINFCGASYTRVDNEQLGNFMPFGDSGFESFDNEIKYRNIIGLSYYKGDKERNIIYNKSPLGCDVFLKDGYIPPEKPTPETVEMLLVYSGLEDKKIKITNKQDIVDIVSYFNDVNDTIKTGFFDSTGTLLSIHAISHEDGGVHYITGSIFKDIDNKILFYTIDGGVVALPENIQNIINSYLV